MSPGASAAIRGIATAAINTTVKTKIMAGIVRISYFTTQCLPATAYMFTWQRLHFFRSKATLPWQAPQEAPLRMSFMLAGLRL